MKGFGTVAAATACSLAMTFGAGCSRSADTARDASAINPDGSGSALTLIHNMRHLWTEHVVWMRSYIVAAAADQPEAQAASDRLMKNQEDIGQVIGKYFGGATGDRLTALLKAHVAVSVALVKAAKAGDEAEQNRVEERADQNAAQIADLLSQANPNWSRGTLNEMLKDHMAKTTAEVDARLNKRWDADVKAFDAVLAQSLKLADALAHGILRQFPGKFER